MGNFCKYCGRPLQEGEVCHCMERNSSNAQQTQYHNMKNETSMKEQYQYIERPKQLMPSYNVNVFSIMSLILGILSLCMTGGIVPAVIAIVFSSMAKKRVKREDILGQKFAKVGLILGIIGCVIWGINVLLALLGIVTLGMMF